MAFMGAKENTCFLFELSHVQTSCDLWQLNLAIFPKLVFEIGINDVLLSFGNELDESTKSAANRFQHGHSYVFPPLVASYLANQQDFSLDSGNSSLLFELACQALYLFAQAREVGLSLKNGEL